MGLFTLMPWQSQGILVLRLCPFPAGESGPEGGVVGEAEPPQRMSPTRHTILKPAVVVPNPLNVALWLGPQRYNCVLISSLL
jgi:hypothetical protein